MNEQFSLVIQLAARHRAIDAIEVGGKVQMIENAAWAALAWGLLLIDHREDRAGKIGRGLHQPVCASGFKFVSGTITPEHAKTAHSDRMGAGNIISAIADHQTVRWRKTMFGQNMGEQFRLVIQLAARH